ncbi:hypothetical protein E2C01_079375 [Portunus trituberculatus]|uniref:Uncharacterized protein n=1 Tax=Portunus trituberculatus TaxID=210409 RepID=A0A5B7IJE7_PORTR|nr:hypothetical protein [Portunus trituberculatus]
MARANQQACLRVFSRPLSPPTAAGCGSHSQANFYWCLAEGKDRREVSVRHREVLLFPLVPWEDFFTHLFVN